MSEIKTIEQSAEKYYPKFETESLASYTLNGRELTLRSQADFLAGAKHQKELSDAREKLLMGVISEMKKSIACASEYLKDSGTQQMEDCEPEYQMLADFTKTLSSVAKKLEGL